MEDNKLGKDFEKYNKIYQKKGVLTKKGGLVGQYGESSTLDKKWDRYGHAFEGKDNFNDVMSLKPKSILDIGCGYNEFIKKARKILKGVEKDKLVGVDIACPGADFIAPAHHLPFEDKFFDLVVSFDCMEHIPEEEVENAFKEFKRVGKRIYLKISLTDSPTKIDGELLHVCVKTTDWWVDIAKRYFKDVKVRRHDKKGTPWANIVITGS
jgi:ubiquinone/menaquinone biosynthesis C-methylase UbiE